MGEGLPAATRWTRMQMAPLPLRPESDAPCPSCGFTARCGHCQAWLD